MSRLPKDWKITASAGSGGGISPSGAVVVDPGAYQAFSIIREDTVYSIVDVLVDGASVGAVASYTFTNVTADHTISASFAINTHTITASAGSGGGISPSGEVTVEHGANQTFTIRPRTGYSINRVTVDGVSVGPVSSYTFRNVVANHTISAYFEERLVRCPSVVGTSLPQAERMISQAGLRVGNVTRTRLLWWMLYMWWLRNKVKAQRPSGGAMVSFESSVDLLVWM